MRVLVTAASKHGATMEIAGTIGDELSRRGVDAVVLPIGEVGGVHEYDAVVLGSAVYAGQWLMPAKELVLNHAESLRARPVWLFSSGPIGDPAKPVDDPADAAAMVEASHAAEHRVFAGKLDRANLGLGEKAIAMALCAPQGDFRDWDGIRAWADEIAAALPTS